MIPRRANEHYAGGRAAAFEGVAMKRALVVAAVFVLSALVWSGDLDASRAGRITSR
jgi:hypothetical protein